jgi:hypothetical protein
MTQTENFLTNLSNLNRVAQIFLQEKLGSLKAPEKQER